MMSPEPLTDKEKGAAWASLILRLAMGSLFIASAVSKLSGGFDNLEEVVAVYQKPFTQTWLPARLVMIHLYLTPFIESLLPVWLFLGLRLRWAWIVTCLYLMTLAFGKVVAQDYLTAAHNYNYVFIAAVGLYLSSYDRFNLCPRKASLKPESRQILREQPV